MLLREKNGNTFEHQFGDVRYKIGPEPVKVPNTVGVLLLDLFSSMLEEVPAPKRVRTPKVKSAPTPKPTSKPQLVTARKVSTPKAKTSQKKTTK